MDASKYNLMNYREYFDKFLQERGVILDANHQIFSGFSRNTTLNNAILLGLYLAHIKKEGSTVGLFVNSDDNGIFEENLDYAIIIETTKTTNGVDSYIDSFHLQEDNVVASFIKQYLRANSNEGRDMIRTAKRTDENGTKRFYIFTSGNITLDFTKVIISLLPRILAGMFTQNELKDMVDVFKNILKSNAQSLVDDIIKTLGISIEDLEREHTLAGMRNSIRYAHKNRLKNLDEKINQGRRECERIINDYKTALKQLNDLLDLCSTDNEKTLDETVDMLYGYMASNPKLCDLGTAENRLYYTVKSDLVYFDEDMFYTIVNNKNWTVYDDLSLSFNYSRQKLMAALNAIFIDRKYHIPVYARYAMAFDNIPSIWVEKNFLLNENLYRSPHPMRHNCTGGFFTLWNEALANGNYIAAIDATVRLTENINWSDVYVVKVFLKDLFQDKLILDKDGNWLDMWEVMEAEG